MNKTFKFKNGCISLSQEGIEISKHEYKKFISFDDIDEIHVSQPKLYRYGIFQILKESDNDFYVPLLEKRNIIKFGLSDSIIMARLRHKIEKESNIEFSMEMDDLELKFFEKIKLFNPVCVVLIICFISFISLNGKTILFGITSVLNGNMAALAFGNNPESAFGFFIGTIVGIVLAWFIMWISTTFNISKIYKELVNKSRFEKATK